MTSKKQTILSCKECSSPAKFNDGAVECTNRSCGCTCQSSNKRKSIEAWNERFGKDCS